MRITKLTDYGILLLCELKQDVVLSSKQLNLKTKVPLATINKVMRLLISSNICASKEGKNGGFYILKPLNQISILDVISSIEGLYDGLTDCVDSKNNLCALAGSCKITNRMKLIDNQIYDLLKNKFISDLIS